MRARALVGWEGCEVRLCDPCARVSPLCPRVSRLSPPVSSYRAGVVREVVRVRWRFGLVTGWL